MQESKLLSRFPSEKLADITEPHKIAGIYNTRQALTRVCSSSVGPLYQGEARAVRDGATASCQVRLQQLQPGSQCD